MALAGLRQRAMRATGCSLETLLVKPAGGPAAQRLSAGPIFGGQRWLRIPSAGVRAARARSSTDGRAWTCMGPLLIDEIERLRSEPADDRATVAPALWRARPVAAASCCCRSAADRELLADRPSLAWLLLVELRLPRALLALAYGAMLGASGAAIQALFANPLASPDLTGTTSGAALGAVVTAYLFGFAAPVALADRRGRARWARWLLLLAAGRAAAPRPRPCCSPAWRSARWPGR